MDRVSCKLGLCTVGQEIPAAAARDLDSDEVTQADDVSRVYFKAWVMHGWGKRSAAVK